MKIFKHQHWHFLVLWLLLVSIYFFIEGDSSFFQGKLWGIDTSIWLILAISSPIIHQIYVLFCWRSELFYAGLSKTLGEKAFKYYKVIFAFLILSRPLTISLLAISNAGTLEINYTLAYLISAILFVPAAYLFYSVKVHFGIDRACGIDHFRPDEIKQIPFVKKGIFKYSSNAMYVFGFFLLWIPGFLLASKAALIVAFFNHAYIWVHYYCTELPDIKFIYKDRSLTNSV